jgi:hypothetical protein
MSPGAAFPAALSDFLAFVQLGFRHIVGPGALDHELFLLALAAIYRPRDWRDAVKVVSAFTVGHSLSLALVVTGALRVSSAVVEFLIPVTILATAVENVAVCGRERGASRRPADLRVLCTGIFGLVHGAGFAGYLRSLFVDRVALPLVGFNCGVEVGQICVLVVAACVLATVDRAVSRARLPEGVSPLRARALTVSALVALVALRWAVERSPWPLS